MSSGDIDKPLDGLLEVLASIEHARWSHWQRYVHSKCIPQGGDGALLIPGDLVKRWEEQIATPYSQLSEAAKESDREQVRKYLPLVVDTLTKKQRGCRTPLP
jgi:hypothetical protein